MSYLKYIKSAFDNKAVRAALFTLPPAALMFYLVRNRKKEPAGPNGSEQIPSPQNKTEQNENLLDAPVQEQSIPDVVQAADLPLETSTGIPSEEPLTGETIDYGECIAVSSKGTRCKRKAIDESHYCWQHKKLASNSAE